MSSIRPRTVATPCKTLMIATTFAMLLGGCAAGPNYRPVAVAKPLEFKEASGWKVAEPRDEVKRGPWWSVFNDSILDGLESRLLQGNQSLAASEAAYRTAEALARQAQSSLWPTLNASAGITRSQQGGAAYKAASAGPVSTGLSNLHIAQLSASWEPDLWGSLRRTAEVGKDTALASLRDYQSARLSLSAELATAYFNLRVADATAKLLDDTVAGYRRALTITQNQFAAGVVGRVDVAEAQTQLDATSAQAVDIRIQRAQFEHVIAVLIGVPPSDFEIAADYTWQPSLPEIPLRVASELLERRPDVAAGERRVAAANAQVGVASAAWFPTLMLSAAGGYETLASSNWFTLPNRFWSLGPQLAESLFDGGRRRAVSAQARAAYDAAVANYRQTALQAFQDVEDSLVTLKGLNTERELQDAAVKSARESALLTFNQYRAGTVSYSTVVAVQQTQLANERADLAIVGRQLAGSVGLIRGMGGDWDPSALGDSAAAVPAIH